MTDSSSLPSQEETQGGMTPLMVAAQAGHEGAVKALLDSGADPMSTSSVSGLTAVHFAAQEGHVAALGCLLSRCRGVGVSPAAGTSPMSSVDSPNAPSALHMACHGGHSGAVELLLATGFLNASIVDGNGDTPLHVAVRSGHADAAKVLLGTEAGRLSTNVGNRKGQLPVDLDKGGELKQILMPDQFLG